MANSNEGSVAPKERVNIVYKPATDGAQSEVELPLKILVVGDFTQADDQRMVEDRTPIRVDKDNFNDVLKAQGLTLDIKVPSKLSGAAEEDQLAVQLKLNTLRDFEPDQIVEQVPELAKLQALREALKSLKSPLSNIPEFRKKIQSIIQDEGARKALLTELGMSEE